MSESRTDLAHAAASSGCYRWAVESKKSFDEIDARVIARTLNVVAYQVVAGRDAPLEPPAFRQSDIPPFHDGFGWCYITYFDCLVPYLRGALSLNIGTLFTGDSGPEPDALTLQSIDLLWRYVGDGECDPTDIVAFVNEFLRVTEVEAVIEDCDEDDLAGYDFITDCFDNSSHARDRLLHELLAVEQRLVASERNVRRLKAGLESSQQGTALEQAKRDLRRSASRIEQLERLAEARLATAERATARAERAEARASQGLSVQENHDSQHVIDDLRGEVAAAEARCAVLLDRLSDVQSRYDAEREKVSRLSAEPIVRVPSAHEARSREASGAEIPSSLRELSAWARAALGHRVVIPPKALRQASRSDFEDPALVYRVLLALADDYWPSKFGTEREAASRRWEQFCRETRISCGPTGDATTNHRTREAYRVNWRGRRVALDMHIQSGNARSTRECLRVYFHVDEQARTIVVGHLPSHLPNRET